MALWSRRVRRRGRLPFWSCYQGERRATGASKRRAEDVLDRDERMFSGLGLADLTGKEVWWVMARIARGDRPHAVGCGLVKVTKNYVFVGSLRGRPGRQPKHALRESSLPTPERSMSPSRELDKP